MGGSGLCWTGPQQQGLLRVLMASWQRWDLVKDFTDLTTAPFSNQAWHNTDSIRCGLRQGNKELQRKRGSRTNRKGPVSPEPWSALCTRTQKDPDSWRRAHPPLEKADLTNAGLSNHYQDGVGSEKSLCSHSRNMCQKLLNARKFQETS